MKKSKIHIAHVMANNPSVPYFNWYADMAQQDEDIQLSFILLVNDENPAMILEMEGKNCSVHTVHFDSSKRKTSMLKAIPKLRQLFRKIKPDVVHSHLFDDSFPALLAARLERVAMRVITKGDTSFHWYYARKGVKFDRMNNKNATHIVALSSESRTFILEKEKADAGKVVLIPHGIPINQFTAQTEKGRTELRRRFNITEDHFVIGTVARFIEWKGYREIVLAAEIITKEFPDARFLFAGKGDQQAEIEKLIREKNLGQFISFTGWIAPSEIPSFYGIMNTFLHAATMEPFGFVIAEAMANALPVVSTSTGAAKDAIENNVNGFLIADKTPGEIAGALRKLIRMDPATRSGIGKKAAATSAKMFSIERMWKDHTELYRSVIGRNTTST